MAESHTPLATNLDREPVMSETIVAVFDTAAHAEAAIRELETAGIPRSSIQHYAKGDTAFDQRGTPGETGHRGFWAWLLGEEGPDYHGELYDRTVESGGTVVTVITDHRDSERVTAILLNHSPVDLEARGSEYGLAGASGPPAGSARTAGLRSSEGGGVAAGQTGKEEVIPLAEETLEVGKRQVSQGAARVRRYVVERPVEEQIKLRDETVSISRRPVTGSATVASDAFTEKTIDVKETSEEAVVSKTARVAEEVVVGRQATERTETVRGTVRREEVDVDRGDEAARRSGGTPSIPQGTP